MTTNRRSMFGVLAAVLFGLVGLDGRKSRRRVQLPRPDSWKTRMEKARAIDDGDWGRFCPTKSDRFDLAYHDRPSVMAGDSVIVPTQLGRVVGVVRCVVYRPPPVKCWFVELAGWRFFDLQD